MFVLSSEVMNMLAMLSVHVKEKRKYSYGTPDELAYKRMAMADRSSMFAVSHYIAYKNKQLVG